MSHGIFRRTPKWILPAHWAVVFMAMLAVAAEAEQPAVNEPLPAIVANAIDGSKVATAISALRKRLIIVQFASSDQANALEQIAQLAAVLADPAMVELDPLWLLILSKTSDPSQLPDFAGFKGIQPTIILDRERHLLGAYQIMVFPTFIVADREQRVVYSLAGPALQFEVLAPAALQLAEGNITRLEFDEILHPPSDAQKHDRDKAESLVQLAQRMLERGLPGSAVDLYEQAIELDPRSLTARIALGELLRRDGKFMEAIPHYEKVLERDPRSRAALLGLAAALISAEPFEPEASLPAESLPVNPSLQRAESILVLLGKEYPEIPRVHYLWGRFFEQQKEYQSAAAAFRKAAELCGAVEIQTADKE